MRILIIVAMLTLLPACVSYGPGSPKELTQATQAATPIGDGKVLIADEAGWWTDTSGAAGIRPEAMKTGGALVITEKSVLWQQWDDNYGKYTTVKRIPAADIKSVSRSDYDSMAVIVVEARNFKHDSFMYRDINDLEKTDRAVQTIRSMVSAAK